MLIAVHTLGAFWMGHRLMLDGNKNEHSWQSQLKDSHWPVKGSVDTFAILPSQSTMTNNKDMEIGILSTKEASFFRSLQSQVDTASDVDRCARYGGTYGTGMHSNANSQTLASLLEKNSSLRPKLQPRRIYFGALIASEPWELLEIVAAEAYGVYSAIVLVESNRTPNFTPRPFLRLNQSESISELFGLPPERVQIRSFVNEDPRLLELEREHSQRAEILLGWKELGMQVDDVGLLADLDETFSRDTLRAVQLCDGLPPLEYNQHYCRHGKVKLRATTRIFESSPECILQNRKWYHPDMILGHCIEGIGNATLHPPAPRMPMEYDPSNSNISSFLRAPGFGSNCRDWQGEAAITNARYPLWNAADFRRTCSGKQLRVITTPTHNSTTKLDVFTAFHLHNFFTDWRSLRFKYQTYAHFEAQAKFQPLNELSNDLAFMHRCIMNIPDILGDASANASPTKKLYRRVPTGFAELLPFVPIYFQDPSYRSRRHAHVRAMVELDEIQRQAALAA